MLRGLRDVVLYVSYISRYFHTQLLYVQSSTLPEEDDEYPVVDRPSHGSPTQLRKSLRSRRRKRMVSITRKAKVARLFLFASLYREHQRMKIRPFYIRIDAHRTKQQGDT